MGVCPGGCLSGGLLPEGCLPGGCLHRVVSSQRGCLLGVSAQGGGVRCLPKGSAAWGVSVQGDVCMGGVCP